MALGGLAHALAYRYLAGAHAAFLDKQDRELRAGLRESPEPRGVSIAAFCKDFNERTRDIKPGVPLRVRLLVHPDRTYSLTIGTPPTSYFLKAVAGVEKGSSRPGHEPAGVVSLAQLFEVAVAKQRDPVVATRGHGPARPGGIPGGLCPQPRPARGAQADPPGRGRGPAAPPGAPGGRSPPGRAGGGRGGGPGGSDPSPKRAPETGGDPGNPGGPQKPGGTPETRGGTPKTRGDPPTK
uniref:translation initiation factor IF-2-like n=1 Tax=Agelaius phoeniceus TaxID=39638 RepID=UPI0023EDEB04|nr:translation initiation factor IF-2-like [Agelaius phoeniceus]